MYRIDLLVKCCFTYLLCCRGNCNCLYNRFDFLLTFVEWIPADLKTGFISAMTLFLSFTDRSITFPATLNDWSHDILAAPYGPYSDHLGYGAPFTCRCFTLFAINAPKILLSSLPSLRYEDTFTIQTASGINGVHLTHQFEACFASKPSSFLIPVPFQKYSYHSSRQLVNFARSRKSKWHL